MWDDVQALRKLCNALLGASLALVLFGAAHYALHSPVFALRAVLLDAEPQRVQAAMIEEVVQRDLRGNFFTVDMELTRRAFEKLPWVRKASVRRHFPWQLEVALEEQVALAHWNGSQLVNTYGEVFAAGDTPVSAYEESGQSLPEFSGPDGAAAEVTQKYRLFGEMLAPLQQEIAQISLSPRRAWRLRMRDGMELELGRDEVEQRMAQFVAAYPSSVAAMRQPVRYVDLRYRNGFAVKTAG